MYRGKFTNFFCLDFVSFSNHYLKYGTVASRGQPFGIGKGFLFRASPVMAILEKDFFGTLNPVAIARLPKYRPYLAFVFLAMNLMYWIIQHQGLQNLE